MRFYNELKNLFTMLNKVLLLTRWKDAGFAEREEFCDEEESEGEESNVSNRMQIHSVVQVGREKRRTSLSEKKSLTALFPGAAPIWRRISSLKTLKQAFHWRKLNPQFPRWVSGSWNWRWSNNTHTVNAFVSAYENRTTKRFLMQTGLKESLFKSSFIETTKTIYFGIPNIYT